MRFKTIALISTTGLLMAGGVQAANIVDWGGDYVSSTQGTQRSISDSASADLDNDGLQDDTRRAVTFSDSVLGNPAIGVNYGGTSDRFYGGVEVLKYDTTGLGLVRWEVLNNGTTDTLSLYYQTPSGASGGVGTGAVLWKQEDYLSVNENEHVRYDGLNSLMLDSAGGIGSTHFTRYLIQINDGQYYVSDDGFSGGLGGGTNTLTVDALTEWIAYDPKKSIDGIANVMRLDNATTTTLNADDIVTAVGFFTTQSFTGQSNGSANFSDFVVDATPSLIPEPASLALMGLGGLMMLGRRRSK